MYLAVKGKVHDVTSGRNFYGPGGPYENFAGRDATRGLACQSFDEEMLTKDLDGPLDDCSDLGAAELENLQGWVERFDEKVSQSRASGIGGTVVMHGVLGHSLLSFGYHLLTTIACSILLLGNSLLSTRTKCMASRRCCLVPVSTLKPEQQKR